MALSSPKKLTSSASFSPSIRISLRLKIHQAQAKNFCRVLDIRVAQVVETDAFHLVRCQKNRKMLREIIRVHTFSHRIYMDIVEIVRAIAFAADLPVKLLLLFIFLSICSQAGIRGSVRKLDFVLVRSRATSIITPSTFPVPNQHQKAVIRGFDSIIHPLFRDANYAFAAILEIFY